jgi:hypothetical protein
MVSFTENVFYEAVYSARDAIEAASLAGAGEGGQLPEPVTHALDV